MMRVKQKYTTQYNTNQWRRQLLDTGARAPLDFQQFHFSWLWSKSDSQLSTCCVVCEISWCRCQQLTALLINTALVTKLLVIEQLLHPALKSAVSAHDIISIFAPPRNKSWRRHRYKLSETQYKLNKHKQKSVAISKFSNVHSENSKTCCNFCRRASTPAHLLRRFQTWKFGRRRTRRRCRRYSSGWEWRTSSECWWSGHCLTVSTACYCSPSASCWWRSVEHSLLLGRIW